LILNPRRSARIRFDPRPIQDFALVSAGTTILSLVHNQKSHLIHIARKMNARLRFFPIFFLVSDSCKFYMSVIITPVLLPIAIHRFSAKWRLLGKTVFWKFSPDSAGTPPISRSALAGRPPGQDVIIGAG
jgi:hypothetical protein